MPQTRRSKRKSTSSYADGGKVRRKDPPEEHHEDQDEYDQRIDEEDQAHHEDETISDDFNGTVSDDDVGEDGELSEDFGANDEEYGSNEEIGENSNAEEIDRKYEPTEEADDSPEAIEHEGFDTRSEAASDSGAERDVYDDVSPKEYSGSDSSEAINERGISPIVFDRSELSDEEDIAPPGETEDQSKKSIVIPPAEIRTQRRDRHSKMLKYLFRDARFFVIKSNNHENISLAKAKGIWSTPPINETKLNKAYKECRNVILVFSVRESGAFQGFARLSTEARRDYGPIQWVLPAGLSAKALGGVFRIDWLCRRELSFVKTGDIRNPFNENKPVKIGRDGQEVEPNAGKMLCLEFPHDDGIDLEEIIHKVRRKEKERGNIRYEVPRYPVPDNGPRSRAAARNRGVDGDFRNRGKPMRRERPGGNWDTRGRPRTNMPSYGRDGRNPGRSHPMRMAIGQRRDSRPSTMQSFGRSYESADLSRSSRSSYGHQSTSYPSLMSFTATGYSLPPPLMQQPSDSSRHASSSNKPASAVFKYSSSSRPSVHSSDYSMKVSSESSVSRKYDSRAHAAACDDFVRRVASGRSTSGLSYGHTDRYSSTSSRSSDRSSSRHSRR